MYNFKFSIMKKITLVLCFSIVGLRVGAQQKAISQKLNESEKELGEKVLLKVMQNSDKYASFKVPEQSLWWKISYEERARKVSGNSEKWHNETGRHLMGISIPIRRDILW